MSFRMPRARSLLDGSWKERDEEGVQKMIYGMEEGTHLNQFTDNNAAYLQHL